MFRWGFNKEAKTMEAIKTDLPNVLIIQQKVFEDWRGLYVELFNKEEFSKISDVEFVEDDYSVSSKNVLRGLHYDEKAWKLIGCPHGRIYLVIVNCDDESEHKGKWLSLNK